MRGAPDSETALIFDIQKFAIHDGPGIRTLVFFKGCPLRCPWCSNPESQGRLPELMLYPNRCIDCGECLEACPQGAVSPGPEGSILTDRSVCLACGACTASCYAEARVMVGKRMSLDEVMTEVGKDSVFYRASGGGLTLGGGEVLLWSGFAAELLAGCRQEGVSTTVETCGYAAWSSLAALLPFVDGWYFDLKHLDAATHVRLTGVPNVVILENLERLAAEGASVTVRIPVIPGYIGDADSVRAIAEHVRGGRLAESIELLPYHRFGADKYARLGRHYLLAGVEPPSEEALETLRGVVEEVGLECRIGG